MQDHKNINTAAYGGGDHVRAKMLAAYLAGKMVHTPLWPIVEEDVLDGSLAANHKAVLVAGINYLDPKVVTALEAYAAGGGTVLLSDDSRIKIAGATQLGARLRRSNCITKLTISGPPIRKDRRSFAGSSIG